MTTGVSEAPPRGTPDQPIAGEVHAHGVLLSKVEHWDDEGVVFVRSTEFDCYAEDEDFDCAVQRFGATFYDLARYLADVVRSGDATQNELETFAIVGPRLLEMFRAELTEADDRRKRLISINLSRHRRGRRGARTHWAPRTTLGSSSQPLSV